jgi:hypothetical protein
MLKSVLEVLLTSRFINPVDVRSVSTPSSADTEDKLPLAAGCILAYIFEFVLKKLNLFAYFLASAYFFVLRIRKCMSTLPFGSCSSYSRSLTPERRSVERVIDYL